jgi:hypothetical protein
VDQNGSRGTIVCIKVDQSGWRERFLEGKGDDGIKLNGKYGRASVLDTLKASQPGERRTGRVLGTTISTH